MDLKNNPSLGDNVELIYIYSLTNKVLQYPRGAGKVVYIGEACREIKTGTRFSQHVSTQKDIGSDTGTNYTLSTYYWSGESLSLKIYLLNTQNNTMSRKFLEGILLQSHMKKYGSLPIAQGASGGNYMVSVIHNLAIPEVIDKIINA